jgi:hypothetical protein
VLLGEGREGRSGLSGLAEVWHLWIRRYYINIYCTYNGCAIHYLNRNMGKSVILTEIITAI